MTTPPAKTIESLGTDDGGRWVTARVGPRGVRADISAGAHDWIVDEPLAVGGTGAGPTPYDYLLSAVSSCMAITLRMYADRKGWPLEGASVRLRTARAHRADCANCETTEVGITRLERQIELVGPLTDEQRQRLLQIADRCPVKQTLQRGMEIETVE
ncbi:MAG: OsmC family protein [Gemmatimonadaceae bacterium]